MPRLEILVIDHYSRLDVGGGTGTHQPPGPCIQTYLVYPEDAPGARYADYSALYQIWRHYTDRGTAPEMIGFYGYRKYLCTWFAGNTTGWRRGHAPNFLECDRSEFDEYREFMSTWNGTPIKELLAQYDILQGASFRVTDDIIQDFMYSRSEHDAGVLLEIAAKYRLYPVPLCDIYPYLFITRWSVFDRMMREMEPLRQELDPLIKGDSDGCDGRPFDAAYTQRPMAYIMERVYSFWLAQSGLRVKEVPLLHCWDL